MDLNITCIEFGYLGWGVGELTLELFVDSTGGEPDTSSMELMGSVTVQSINTGTTQLQIQTATFPNPVSIVFPNKLATLVAVLSIPANDEGMIIAAGTDNKNVKGTNQETYMGGYCRPDYVRVSEYSSFTSDMKKSQWFVKLTGTSSTTSSSSGNGNLCFAGDSTVALADGSLKPISDLRIGDKVLAAAIDGSIRAADVVFLPHL